MEWSIRARRRIALFKIFLQACFFVSKMILYLYGWAALSISALSINIMMANVIFYSGLIYGILWLFEKQFTLSEEVKE